MWSFLPNFSYVGPTVWPPIKNTHTHGHLYCIDRHRCCILLCFIWLRFYNILCSLQLAGSPHIILAKGPINSPKLINKTGFEHSTYLPGLHKLFVLWLSKKIKIALRSICKTKKWNLHKKGCYTNQHSTTRSLSQQKVLWITIKNIFWRFQRRYVYRHFVVTAAITDKNK